MMKTQSIRRELVVLGALLTGCGSGAGATAPSPTAVTEGMRAETRASSAGDAGCATPPSTCVATGPLQVFAWGANDYGQSAASLAPAPVRIPTALPTFPSNIVMLAAGDTHNLALDDEGNVWAWGGDACGESGVRPPDYRTDVQCYLAETSGSHDTVAVPTRVPLPGRVTSIAAGLMFSAAIMDDGTVMTWGYDLTGELGNDVSDYVPHWVPQLVRAGKSPLSGVTSLSAGAFHVIATTNDGQVWGWGSNYHGELALDGLGYGINGPRGPYPVPPTILSAVPSNARGIIAGGLHTYYVENGNVWGFGDYWNSAGTGGSATASRVPLQIPGPAAIREVAAGGYFGLALGSRGDVWSWGDQEVGELGYETLPGPARITNLTTPIVDIWAGDNSGFAKDTTGQLWAWGRDDYGELGGTQGSDAAVPIRVSGITGVTLFSTQGEHNLALAYECAPPPR